MSQVIAIAGFTGKLAGLITTALLRHPNVQIHGICRSPEKVAPAFRNLKNVKIFQASSNDTEALRKGLQGSTTCLCGYLGDRNFMVEGQKTLIDACIEEKVPRYIAADWSLDVRGLEPGDHPGKDFQLEILKYLDDKEAAGKIKAVHILTGAFTEMMCSPYVGYFDMQANTVSYWGTGDEPLDMTTMKDVASYTAEIAINPDDNGWINVLGDSKSIKEIASSFEKVYGVPLSLQRLGSLEDLHGKMIAAQKAHPQNTYAWAGLTYQYFMANGQTKLGPLSNDRFPSVRPLTHEEFLKTFTKDTIINAYK
jgi:hypothetical protein